MKNFTRKSSTMKNVTASMIYNEEFYDSNRLQWESFPPKSCTMKKILFQWSTMKIVSASMIYNGKLNYSIRYNDSFNGYQMWNAEKD